MRITAENRVAVIAAVAKNGVIGANNGIPWRLPDDLRRFQALTAGHTVIMGRRTWESIGSALPQRQNIVVSRSPSASFPGAQTARSLSEAYEMAALPGSVFVIGGEYFYREALAVASKVYLTEIHEAFEGDVFFPALDLSQWKEQDRELRESRGLRYDFVEYSRA